jgi:hypothetical protein
MAHRRRFARSPAPAVGKPCRNTPNFRLLSLYVALFGGTFWRPDFDVIYVGKIWLSTGSTLRCLNQGNIINVKTNVNP